MDPALLQPGYRLDRYELLCPLAYGGMASVWLARFGGSLGFERIVVVKMILPQYSQDSRFQEMFLDEARIASKIEHSNVARILDVGEQRDNYYIVMEWVDGDSLSKLLRAAEQTKERIPYGIAMRIIADAAAGLHAAHELKAQDGTLLGVVHRDVSPQNILVSNSGSATIIDFGVAKARDRVSQETSAGQLKGKIRYMAPEQALGRKVDHRADVWALGAMLYETFVGTPPYDGENEIATLHKLTSGRPPPKLPSSTPNVVRTVVERALAYEQQERFSSALELSMALEGAMVELNEPTTTVDVANYANQLLSERKAARRRAVDAALENARRRENGQPALAALPPAALSTSALPRHAISDASIPVGPRESSPRYPSMSGSLDLNDVPSIASSATFGSANMEYLSARAEETEPSRRRYFAAATLGISIAGGVIGVILIATAMRNDSSMSTSMRDDALEARDSPLVATTLTAASPTSEPPSAPWSPATAEPSDDTPTSTTDAGTPTIASEPGTTGATTPKTVRSPAVKKPPKPRIDRGF